MPQAIDPVTQHHLDQAAERLAEEFAGIFSQETIARYMAESQDLLGEARITAFVPVLAHRFARERLRALAQAEGIVGKDQPEVLFVCVHNAGRSQMAAGLLKLRSQGRIHVRSAGSTPAEEINPNAVTALEELGVDMGEEFPKPLSDEVVRAADVVITMGCGDACPIYPGKKYEDWELEDPAGKDLATVRRIRDDHGMKDLPVVIVSYKDRDEDRLRGLEVGANAYLTKSSFHDHTFLDAVAALIGKA